MRTGKCGCGAVTYRMTSAPMLVHNCHCSDCQRQTGSAYVLNAMIERDRIEVSGPLREVVMETPSGSGQKITRCAECGVAIFSAYLVRSDKIAFVRVGTLDDPNECPPDVQIFTSTKQDWVRLRDDIPAYAEFYKITDVWPADALARRVAVLAEPG